MSVDQIVEATEGDALKREGRETRHVLGWHRHASEGVVAVGGIGTHIDSIDITDGMCLCLFVCICVCICEYMCA